MKEHSIQICFKALTFLLVVTYVTCEFFSLLGLCKTEQYFLNVSTCIIEEISIKDNLEYKLDNAVSAINDKKIFSVIEGGQETL